MQQLARVSEEEGETRGLHSVITPLDATKSCTLFPLHQLEKIIISLIDNECILALNGRW